MNPKGKSCRGDRSALFCAKDTMQAPSRPATPARATQHQRRSEPRSVPVREEQTHRIRPVSMVREKQKQFRVNVDESISISIPRNSEDANAGG